MLGSEGASVVVADIDRLSAETTASDINAEASGIGKAFGIALDVGKEAQVQQALGLTVEHFGRLDAVVNNAGIDVTIGIRELTVADWDRVIRTNLTGPFLLAKYCLEHLSPGGHIVNIASTAARRAWPNASVYHASKWGLMGLSHALHAELRSTGVKVLPLLREGCGRRFYWTVSRILTPTCYKIRPMWREP